MDFSAPAGRGMVCAVCMLAANLVIFGLWLTDPAALASNMFSLGAKGDTRKHNYVKMMAVNGAKTNVGTERVQGAHVAPKVALMFLTMGPLPHEPSWRAFFEAAARVQLAPKSAASLAPETKPEDLVGKLKPRIKPYPNREDYLTYVLQDGGGYARELLGESQPQEESIDEEHLLGTEVGRLLEGLENGKKIREAQSLFSVYVNVSPGFKYPSNSLFHGAVIPNTVNVIDGYGQWVTVESQLEMIREALKDPRNEKFTLLSESCIPIYSPDIIYAQLIGDPRSNIKACPGPNSDTSRRRSVMLTKHFKEEHWRKSGQWSALNRDHSLLVMEDQHVKEMFKRYCFRRRPPHYQGCTPNEHYIPSLLGSYQLHNQTTCHQLTYTEWPDKKTTHPRSFNPLVVNTKLIRGFHGKKCNPAPARSTVHCLFKPKPGFDKTGENMDACSPTEQTRPTWVTDSGYQLLPRCPLFARKFKKDTVRQVLEAVLSCDGVGLGHWC